MISGNFRAPCILAALALCLVVTSIIVSYSAAPAMAQATGNKAIWPKNFDDFILYATYDRGSAKEEAFALRETIEASKSGEPLPYGTQLVLSIWKNNALTGYFVMEKGVNWGVGFPEDEQTGDWHFQEFDTNGQVRRTATADRCQSCHSSQANNEYMFTIDRMRAYLP
jgi:hypothetical protein